MSLYLHYKPTKADLIHGILDYWDPCFLQNLFGGCCRMDLEVVADRS